MERQALLDYLNANAVLAGPATDVSGELWRYSATIRGHQAVSGFFKDPNDAKVHVFAVLAEAIEAHAIDIPEIDAYDVKEIEEIKEIVSDQEPNSASISEGPDEAPEPEDEALAKPTKEKK